MKQQVSELTVRATNAGIAVQGLEQKISKLETVVAQQEAAREPNQPVP